MENYFQDCNKNKEVTELET